MIIETDANATEEELAAIVAAYEALWPRPVSMTEPPTTPAWRFSGRWWRGPTAHTRGRPI